MTSSIVAFVAEGNALNTVINLQEAHDVRGSQSWYRLTRDATGKTGARLKRLAAKVHQPKHITDYKNALVELTNWDSNLKDLVKIEGQGLSELTKITILNSMVPADFMRDIDRDKSLKTFDQIWNYVTEQVEVRKHWPKVQMQKDPSAMDIDAAEKEEVQQNESVDCQPCTGEDLDTLKGGCRGTFQGYCGYCNALGHKRSNCRKRLADIVKVKGKDGKGKDGKGKDGK